MAFIHGLSLSIGIGLDAFRSFISPVQPSVGDYSSADYSPLDYNLV